MKRNILVFVFAVAMVTASAQTSAPQQNPAIDPNWVVPAKAATVGNPLAGKPEAAMGGKKIFVRSCAMCHGDEKNQRKNNAPDLSSTGAQLESDGALFWRISNGNSRRGMPSFSSLPEGQRWQLVLYIRSMAAAKAK